MIGVTNAWVLEGREVDVVDLAGHVMARARPPRRARLVTVPRLTG